MLRKTSWRTTRVGLDVDAMSDDETATTAIRTKLEGTNINSVSLLATDYLNHINEAVMLLEMVPEMPDFLEDVKEWQPKSYAQHFSDSGFTDKDLAIEAYDHAPAAFRAPFDQTIAQIDELLLTTVKGVDKLVGNGPDERISVMIKEVTTSIHQLIEQANAIINGSVEVLDQTDVDAILASEPSENSVQFSKETALLLYGEKPIRD